jgi:hypothetical protein
MLFSTPDFMRGLWVPPAAGGLCIVTAHATNGDGLTSAVQVAVLAHAGSALPDAQPPSLSVGIFTPNIFCSNGTASVQCGTFPPGTPLRDFANVSWGNGLAGSVTVTDSCAGAQTVFADFDSFTSSTWTVPDLSGTTCTTLIVATNLEGDSTQGQVQYVIASP